MVLIHGKIDNGILSVERNSRDVVTFDLEGRLIYYTADGKTYRRSLENKFIRLAWDGKDRIVEDMSAEEASALVNEAYSLAQDLSSSVEDKQISAALSELEGRDWNWLVEDAEKMRHIYGSSIPIIPPDQYFSLYLQLSKGCAWNKCTFCKLYQDRKYDAKDLEAFEKHLQEIKNFFGKGLESRHGVFMGDANAINVDQKILISALDKIKEELNLPVYSFVDAFTTPKKKKMMHYEEMRKHGLKRVYIGLESGSAKVLHLLNKLMNVSEVLNMVNNLKMSGIGVGLIIMTGAGGHKYWKDHVIETASILSQMDLSKGDMIYLSPMVEYEDLDYQRIAKDQDLGILSDEEKKKQADELSSAVKESFQDVSGRPLEVPIARYDLREAIY